MPNQITSQSPGIKFFPVFYCPSTIFQDFYGIYHSSFIECIKPAHMCERYERFDKSSAHISGGPYRCTSLNHVKYLWWDHDEILKITSLFVCELYRETPVRAVKCVSEWTRVSRDRQGRPILLWRFKMKMNGPKTRNHNWIISTYNELKGGKKLFVATIDFCIFAVCGLSGINLQFYQGFKVVKSF